MEDPFDHTHDKDGFYSFKKKKTEYSGSFQLTSQ